MLQKVQEENVERKIREAGIKLREEITGKKGGMAGGGILLPGAGADMDAQFAANAARDARLMATEARMGDLAHELREERDRHYVSDEPYSLFYQSFHCILIYFFLTRSHTTRYSLLLLFRLIKPYLQAIETKIRSELESGLDSFKGDLIRLRSELEATYQASTRQEREAQRIEAELRAAEGHFSELQVSLDINPLQSLAVPCNPLQSLCSLPLLHDTVLLCDLLFCVATL